MISNLADAVSAQDAVNLRTLQQYLQGVAWKQPVRVATAAALPAYTYANGASGVGATITANANGALPAQDGVTLVNGDRLLVKDETAGNAPYNGIYEVTDVGSAGTPFVLTRTTDADTSLDLLQAAVFTEEGTTQADYAYVNTANAPIVVGTTNLVFILFSAVVSYTFDQGLLLTGASVKVDLDTAAAAQTAGAGGGSSGLEFDVNTAAGKLRLAVEPTGGLSRQTNGAGILIDPHANTTGNNTSLSTSAAGTLVTRAPKVDDNYTYDTTVAAGDPVQWATTANRVRKCQANNDALAFVMGVAKTAGTAGQTGEVVNHGPCLGVLSGATPGAYYYLAAAGGLTTAIPGGNTRTVRVGYAMNATDLWVEIADFGKKA